MTRTFVKICGITTVDQGVSIARMGADALGFILYPKSPRYLKPDLIAEIVRELPPFTNTVGVFVNESPETLSEILQLTGLDIAQLSGDETEDYMRQLSDMNVKWLQSCRVREEADISAISACSNRFILCDAWSEDAFGGTGKTFDWKLLDGVDRSRIILAGGLNPDNVETAIREVRPYGIDVSSGVEISPGIKNLEMVQSLLNKVLHCSS